MTREATEIHQILLRKDLSSFDPYDIWKTRTGLWIKDLFNRSRLLGALPALFFTLIDLFINNSFRLGYKKQEFPIARAMAALTLLNHFESSGDADLLPHIKNHLEWLKHNSCKGYSGPCWGLGFKWPAAAGVVYDENTPFSTHTPYALEAFHRYTLLSHDEQYLGIIKSCFDFFDKDLYVMYDDADMMAISYGPFKDRIATNAVSYAMYAYAIFLMHFPEKEAYIKRKISKLYNFIRARQQADGSWYYTPDDPNSFIDCFHSCFIIKNIEKTNKIIELEDSALVAEKGRSYIMEYFFDPNTGLYKRFTKKNKFSLVKFDLYDNAEVLTMVKMAGNKKAVKELETAIASNFIKNDYIYSVIDILGIKKNKNTLRWAVMPYLYAKSITL